MKIGILGGTYNPIHQGHLLIGEYVLDELKLDKVLVMPNRKPMYKDIVGGVSDEMRKEMIHLSIKDNENLIFSDMELKREGATYTVDTLYQLREEYKDAELFFIMGEDSLKSFHKWVRTDEIVRLCTLVVTKRNSSEDDQRISYKEELEKQYKDIKIILSDCPYYELSSSDIRNRVKEGKSVRYMVSEAVNEYIKEHGLYLG